MFASFTYSKKKNKKDFKKKADNPFNFSKFHNLTNEEIYQNMKQKNNHDDISNISNSNQINDKLNIKYPKNYFYNQQLSNIYLTI